MMIRKDHEGRPKSTLEVTDLKNFQLEEFWMSLFIVDVWRLEAVTWSDPSPEPYLPGSHTLCAKGDVWGFLNGPSAGLSKVADKSIVNGRECVDRKGLSRV